VITTRQGNAGSWTLMVENGVAGDWTLTLTREAAEQIKNEKIEDILFVLTYSGRMPEWPA
jgi:hypothetical protein